MLKVKREKKTPQKSVSKNFGWKKISVYITESRVLAAVLGVEEYCKFYASRSKRSICLCSSSLMNYLILKASWGRFRKLGCKQGYLAVRPPVDT